MKQIVLALLLVVLESSEQIELSPVCPDSTEKTYHESMLPNTDFYVCQNGFVTDFLKCHAEAFNPECDSCDPCCKMYSTKYSETIPVPISTTESTETTPKPILTKEKILEFVEGTLKDYTTYAKQDITTPSYSTPETTTAISDEECTETGSVFTHSITDVESQIPNVESVTESNLEIATDISKTKPDYGEPYIAALKLPTNTTKPGEKFKEFTREVIIPVIENIVNDYSKMSVVSSLFRKYLHAFVPLATDIMDLPEDYPGSGIKVPRQQITDAMLKISDASPLLEKVLLENMPSVFYKIGDNFILVLDTIEETQKRFHINFFTLPIKYFFLYLQNYDQIKNSTDEFITFKRIGEVRRDIEVASKLMMEVVEDEMFIEKLNPTAIMIQLLFF